MNSIKTINRPLKPSSKTKTVTVVGMSDCGCGSLTAQAVNAVSRAQALVGGERHLTFFPQFEGVKVPIKGKITEVMKQVEELSQENHVVVLSSGDPMYFGIGGLLVKKLGLDNVDIIAHPGSVQLAFSKIGMNWDDALTLSLHGRSRKGFITKIQTHHKIAVFTDAENSPKSIAEYMFSFGEDNWKAWVCEHLGGTEERVRTFSIEELSKTEGISELNILILIRDNHGAYARPVIAFLHEDEFEKRMPKKGLITKREVRLLSLGFMQLRKDSVIWDIGTASGSVAIEAAKICSDGAVYAIEVDQESVEICKQNIMAHKVDNVEVIEGRAPEALKGLPPPDSIFVGGSKGSMHEILDVCLEQLKENGTLVVNAITLENVQEAYEYFKEKNLRPEIILLNVSRGVPLAHYHRYEALNPIHIFAVRKNKVAGKV